MDLTCLSIYPPLPPIPEIANDSNTSVHPAYEPNRGGISQMISGSIIHATFSTNDIHSLLNNLLNKSFSSWDASEITKTNPVPSIIIYSSIALALTLIFSLIFCIVSCRNSKKYEGRKRRQSKTTQICACLVILVYLLGIGDMIYVAYRINKLKGSLDDTIKEVNQDIYPKEISEHIEYLNKQFNQLDQYCVQPNSILINASKSMLVQAFDDILTEKYLVKNIALTINKTDEHIRELSDEIDKQPTILPPVIELFKQIQQQFQSIIDNIQIPIKEVCKYENGTQTDIDQKLLEALDVVNVQLKKLIGTINENILSKITPWQEKMLMKTDLEEQVRGYVSMAGIIFLVLVFVLGGIPSIFLVFIMISRLCNCCQNGSGDDKSDRVPMTSVAALPDTMSIEDFPENEGHGRYRKRNKIVPVDYHRQQSKPTNGVVLCLMRIAFFVMIILLIVLVILTGVFYALDLAVQGTCRTVHDDQPFLVNLISDKLIGSNVTFGNSTEMNRTVMNVIEDCRDHVHFSRKLLENYWSTLDNGVNDMMNILSEHIYDEFIQSFGKINISSDIDILAQFVMLANVSNLSNISVLGQRIKTDLMTLEGYFDIINSTNATLPPSLVQTTIDQFENYVKNVLESTIDGCPLPLAILYKTDTLVCHTLGGSISGLWLSIFFFMALVTVGLCIFGVCVYKRLDSSSGSTQSSINRF